MEQLEAQGGSSKFLFPSLKTELRGKKERKCWKLDEAVSYDNARCALLNAVKETKIKIKGQNGPFGLHSFRVGALTAAANTGQFSNIQLQAMGRWAQLDSAARYSWPGCCLSWLVGELALTVPFQVLPAKRGREVQGGPGARQAAEGGHAGRGVGGGGK